MTLAPRFCSKCGNKLDKAGYVCSSCIEAQKVVTREQSTEYRKLHNRAVRIAVDQLKHRHNEEYEELLEAAKTEVGLHDWNAVQ